MGEPTDDMGLITAIIKRAVEIRLPRAEVLKEKVDAGGVLDDRDVAFLKEIFDDARTIGPIIDQHPEYHDIGMRMLSLYKEITAKALENEKARGGG